MSQPRIVLADDHRVFAEGLAMLLESHYEIAAIAEHPHDSEDTLASRLQI